MESVKGVAAAPEYYYWDGKIIRARDGTYHLFESSWAGSLGFGNWGKSDAVHSVSTGGILGPYTRQGFVYDDGPDSGDRHRGHNVSAAELPDGTYAVIVSEVVPFTIFTASSPSGPFTNKGHAQIDRNGIPLSIPAPGDQNLESNVALVVRPDGNFEIVQRHGIIALSTVGVLGPYKVQQPTTTYPADQAVPSTLASIYPNRKTHSSPGAPQTPESTYVYAEDPVIWFSGGQYHVIYNYPDDRVAYHLTSTDGIHDWTDRGVAYDPRQAQKLFSYVGDTTINKWYKMERPGVVMDNGHVTYFTFAVADVDKNNQIPANSNHGSKVVVVPFDGASFDADTGVGGSSGAGGTSSTGGASAAGGSRGSGGGSNAGGTKTTAETNATGGTKSNTGGLTSTGSGRAAGGSMTGVNSGGTTAIVTPTGGRVAAGGAVNATGGAVATSGGAPSSGGSKGIGGELGGDGTSPTGGTHQRGGTTALATTVDAGTPGSSNNTGDSGSCGCRVAGTQSRSTSLGLLGLVGLGILQSLRRRTTPTPSRNPS